jgi:hypothetical protein
LVGGKVSADFGNGKGSESVVLNEELQVLREKYLVYEEMVLRGDPAADKILAEIDEQVRQDVFLVLRLAEKDQANNIRKLALLTIWALEIREAIPLVIRLLQEGDDPQIMRELLSIATRLQAEQAVPVVNELLYSESLPDGVLDSALNFVRTLGSLSSSDALLWRVRNDKDTGNVRSKVIRVLAAIGNGKVAASFIEIVLNSPNEERALEVASWLQKVPKLKEATTLLEEALRAPGLSRRRYLSLITALGATRSPVAVKFLLDIGMRNSIDAYQVMIALSQNETPEAADAMFRLATEHVDPLICASAKLMLWTCCQLDLHSDDLLLMYRHEQDPSLKISLARALAKCKLALETDTQTRHELLQMAINFVETASSADCQPPNVGQAGDKVDFIQAIMLICDLAPRYPEAAKALLLVCNSRISKLSEVCGRVAEALYEIRESNPDARAEFWHIVMDPSEPVENRWNMISLLDGHLSRGDEVMVIAMLEDTQPPELVLEALRLLKSSPEENVKSAIRRFAESTTIEEFRQKARDILRDMDK